MASLDPVPERVVEFAEVGNGAVLPVLLVEFIVVPVEVPVDADDPELDGAPDDVDDPELDVVLTDSDDVEPVAMTTGVLVAAVEVLLTDDGVTPLQLSASTYTSCCGVQPLG